MSPSALYWAQGWQEYQREEGHQGVAGPDQGDLAPSSQYLEFVRVDVKGRKTEVWQVRSKSSHTLLGQVKWYGAWRQYCFWPEPRTIFNTGCMDDIQRLIALLMRARRASKDS